MVRRLPSVAMAGVTFTCPIAPILGYPVPTITTTSALPVGVTLADNGIGTASLIGTPAPDTGGVGAS